MKHLALKCGGDEAILVGDAQRSGDVDQPGDVRSCELTDLGGSRGWACGVWVRASVRERVRERVMVSECTTSGPGLGVRVV